MRWSDLPLNPPVRTLRRFAGLWVVFFGSIACWQGFAHDRTALAAALGVLAAAVGLLGLVKPAAVRPVFAGGLILTFPIGWVVSRVLLTGIYYGLFTPIALFFRLVGRDALRRRPQPAAESYWVPKPAAAGVHSYFRQY